MKWSWMMFWVYTIAISPLHVVYRSYTAASQAIEKGFQILVRYSIQCTASVNLKGVRFTCSPYGEENWRIGWWPQEECIPQDSVKENRRRYVKRGYKTRRVSGLSKRYRLDRRRLCWRYGHCVLTVWWWRYASSVPRLHYLTYSISMIAMVVEIWKELLMNVKWLHWLKSSGGNACFRDPPALVS